MSDDERQNLLQGSNRRITPIDAKTGDLVQPKSLVAELYGSRQVLAGTCVIFANVLVLGAAAGLMYYRHYSRFNNCDQPLSDFFGLMGVVIGAHGLLLMVQTCYPLSAGGASVLSMVSLIPSLAELAVLIVGTLWWKKVEACNPDLLRHTEQLVVALWICAGLGIIFKAIHWSQTRKMAKEAARVREQTPKLGIRFA